jgi:hypothetical protein
MIAVDIIDDVPAVPDEVRSASTSEVFAIANAVIFHTVHIDEGIFIPAIQADRVDKPGLR